MTLKNALKFYSRSYFHETCLRHNHLVVVKFDLVFNFGLRVSFEFDPPMLLKDGALPQFRRRLPA